MEPFDRAIDGGSGGEDRLHVSVHDFQPVRDVMRVIVPKSRRHGRVGTRDRRSEFGTLS